MAFKIDNRVRQTSTTTGTGSLTLDGSVSGYLNFSDVYSTGDTGWYVIDLAPDFEIGEFTFTSPSTLARTTIYRSSNANAAVNWPAGAKRVFVAVPATYLSPLRASAQDKYLVRSSASAGPWEEGSISTFAQARLAESSAASWQTALSLVPGTNVQAFANALSYLAALTAAADRLPYFNASNSAALATFTAAARNLLDDADAATMRTTLGLAIGTNVQAFANALAYIAALTPASNRLPYYDSASSAALAVLTSIGRDIIGGVDAAAVRTTLDVERLGIKRGVNAQTGTSYTFVLADAGKLVTFSSASPTTVTVPPFASVAFEDATVLEIARIGTGTVTIAGGSGVTVNSAGGDLILNTQYAGASIVKRTTNAWLAFGNFA